MPRTGGASSKPNQTPPYARHLVRLIRPWPDFDFPFMKALRAEAVRQLWLSPGARVLDAGCGPGGSFPYLVDAVGPSGEVVGVEISPDVAVNARRRVDRHRWRDVRVLEADARSVPLEGTFDGLLMFAAQVGVGPEPPAAIPGSPALVRDDADPDGRAVGAAGSQARVDRDP